MTAQVVVAGAASRLADSCPRSSAETTCKENVREGEMKRALLFLMFVAAPGHSHAGDYKQEAYKHCLKKNGGKFSEQTTHKLCECYADKMATFSERLSSEYRGNQQDFEAAMDNPEAKRYLDEFVRVCLFKVAPVDELEASGIVGGH